MNKNLKKLISKIGAGKKILTIPVKVECYSKVLQCFDNVLLKINNDGGSVHYGWKIHKGPIVYEAERHAVWVSPNNEFIDITPEYPSVPTTLFVSDNKFTYYGQHVDNIRINITTNAIVDDFIFLNETISRLLQLSKRVDTNHVSVSEPVAKTIENLRGQSVMLEMFIYTGGRPDSLCFCRSSLVYKNCHGRYLRETATGLINEAEANKGTPIKC